MEFRAVDTYCYQTKPSWTESGLIWTVHKTCVSKVYLSRLEIRRTITHHEGDESFVPGIREAPFTSGAITGFQELGITISPTAHPPRFYNNEKQQNWGKIMTKIWKNTDFHLSWFKTFSSIPTSFSTFHFATCDLSIAIKKLLRYLFVMKPRIADNTAISNLDPISILLWSWQHFCVCQMFVSNRGFSWTWRRVYFFRYVLGLSSPMTFHEP